MSEVVIINHYKIDRDRLLPSLKGLNTTNCGCKPQSEIRTPFINPEGVELKIPQIAVEPACGEIKINFEIGSSFNW